jgi:iron complex outermembrane receptor protein
MLSAQLFVLLLLARPECPAGQGDCRPTAELPAVEARERRETRSDAAVELDLGRWREGRRALDLTEALSELPGFVARPRFNEAQDAQVNVRGFGARSPFGVRGLRIEYDGIPATAADGQSQISHFDVSRGGTLTLIRGPFAALYGNGGAYLAVEGPASAGTRGRVSAAAGSSSQWQLGVTAAAGEDIGLLVQGQRSRGNGARAQSAAERTLGSARLSLDTGEIGQLTLVAHSFDQPFAQDPQGLTREEFILDPGAASPSALAFDTRKRSSQYQAGARQRLEFDQTTLDLATYAGTRAIEQYLSVPPAAQALPTSGGGVVDLDRSYGGASIALTHRAALGGMAAEFSAYLRHERIDEDRLGYENFLGETLGVRGALRRDERNLGWTRDLMLRADLDPVPDLRLSAGVRRSWAHYESEDRYIRPGNPDDSGRFDHSAVLPVLGFSYRLYPGLEWHGAVGKGQELPTLAELAYRADGEGGFNPELEPARSRQLELGVRAAGERSSFDLTAFLIRVEDEIVVDSASGGRTRFRNAGATEREGLEASWQWRPGPQWRLLGTASWIDARYRDPVRTCPRQPCPQPVTVVQAGAAIPGVPELNGRVALEWRPERAWSAALEWQGFSSTPASDRNRDRVPGHALVNARLVHRLGQRFALTARIDNLFDKDYSSALIVNEGQRRYYEPGPGRRWWLGIEYGL